MAHCWSEPQQIKKKFCCVCRRRLDDALAVSCDICEYYAHLNCQEFAVSDCKECATFSPHRDLSSTVNYHHWREVSRIEVGSDIPIPIPIFIGGFLVADTRIYTLLCPSIRPSPFTVRCIKKDTSQSSCFRDSKSTFWDYSWEHLKELQKTETLPPSSKSLINLFRFYDKLNTRYQKQQ